MNQTIIKQSSFGAFDYGVFSLMLIISTSIGLYFGFRGGGRTTEDYLFGGRKMKSLPIAISLIASQLSGIVIISLPAEIYLFGTQYYMMAPFMALSVLIVNYIFIPVFYSNRIKNCYEYLEIRFNKSVRNVVTLFFFISHLLALPVIMYVPAIAFSQVSGMDLHLINFVVSLICVVYTMLGGVKAVVWTDVFQATIMFGSCIIVSFTTISKIGGVTDVWRIADEGKRLEFFNMKLDLTTRHTFWNAVIGYTAMWSTYVGLNQISVQRILSVPSVQHARKSLWGFYIGFLLILTINTTTGIAMFVKYLNCDPLKAKIVDKSDKLIPYLVQDVVGHIPGMPGLFISCVFSAALSTMSAFLNTFAGVIYYDFVKKLNLFKDNESNDKIIMKILVIIIGMYSVLGGVLVSNFQYIHQLLIVISGTCYGAILGVFLLGMLWPYSNSKGTFIGGIVGFCSMVWLIVGTQIRTFQKELGYTPLPTSIAGCQAIQKNITDGFKNVITMIGDDSFSIYKISYAWYTIIGCGITFIVGAVVSFIFGGADRNTLYLNLFPPIIHKLLPKYVRSNITETKTIRNNFVRREETVKTVDEIENMLNR